MNILNGLYLSKNGFHWTISLAPALCLETTQENVKICSLSTSLEGKKELVSLCCNEGLVLRRVTGIATGKHLNLRLNYSRS